MILFSYNRFVPTLTMISYIFWFTKHAHHIFLLKYLSYNILSYNIQIYPIWMVFFTFWMILIHANCILISFSNGNYFRFPVQVVWNHEETMHIKGAALLEIVISKLEFFTKVKNHSNLDCMMSTWTILEYIYSKFLWYKYTPTPHSWRLVLLLHIFAM